MNNPIKTLVKRIIHQGLESFGRHYSMYRGYVLNDTPDPLNQDRLFVYVPHISGLKKTGNWAWPKGIPQGLHLLPKKGDMVWVEFQYGDYRYPTWSYANQNPEITKLTNPHTEPGDLKWKTDKGHELWIKNRLGEIHLKHSNGCQVKLTNEGVEIIDLNENHITLTEEGIDLNGNENEGLVKVNELHSEISQIKNDINNLKTLIKTWVPAPSGDGGASLKTFLTDWVSRSMRIPTKEALQNDKVRH